jgi:hypothetical protein
MIERIIETSKDSTLLANLLSAKEKPYTVRIYEGKKRSNPQNRLQWKWYSEAARDLGEDTADGYHAYCKLHFGVPIMRENDEFRAAYNRVLRGLTYEQKLEAMGAVLDFPVTRLMTTKQKTRYLDAVFSHFYGLGVQLTEPEEANAA